MVQNVVEILCFVFLFYSSHKLCVWLLCFPLNLSNDFLLILLILVTVLFFLLFFLLVNYLTHSRSISSFSPSFLPLYCRPFYFLSVPILFSLLFYSRVEIIVTILIFGLLKSLLLLLILKDTNFVCLNVNNSLFWQCFPLFGFFGISNFYEKLISKIFDIIMNSRHEVLLYHFSKKIARDKVLLFLLFLNKIGNISLYIKHVGLLFGFYFLPINLLNPQNRENVNIVFTYFLNSFLKL